MTISYGTASERWGLYAVTAGSTQLGGITQQSLRTMSEIRAEALSGEPYPRFASIVSQKPLATWTTKHIATALGIAGPLGVSITNMSNGLKLFAQKYADGTTRGSGSLHRSFTINRGIVVPTTLQAAHRGDATISYQAHVVYDGTNNPIIPADTVALTAISADAERFALGPFTLEGVCSGQLEQLSINFGINVETIGSESAQWDTLSGIVSIQPVITLKGSKLTWFAASGAIPLLGKAITQAASYFYLRKRLPNGTFELDATAAHLKFCCAGLAHVDAPMEASGSAPAECSIQIQCVFDGTNSPIVATPSTAIA